MGDGKDAMGLQLVLPRVFGKVCKGCTSDQKAAARKQWEGGCVEAAEPAPKSATGNQLTQAQCLDAKKLTDGKDAMGLQLVLPRVLKKVCPGCTAEQKAAAQKQWEGGCVEAAEAASKAATGNQLTQAQCRE